jgi:GAF domain-containing protein
MIDQEKTFLRVFIEVTQAITSHLNLDEVFSRIVCKIPESMRVDAATIRLLDPAGKKLVLQAAHGLSEDYLHRGPLDLDSSVIKALQGEPTLISDASEDPDNLYPEESGKEGIRSILVVPIPIRGEIKGVLRLLIRSATRDFRRDEVEFVTALAEQCGIAIENARIYEEQNRQLNYFKAILEIGRKINATRKLDEILNLIVTQLTRVMDLKACTIRLIAENSRKLELKAAYGLSKSYLERGPLDDELATYYLMKGEPVVIPDATVDLHTIYHKEAAEEGVGSVLAVPILYMDETIGIIRLLTSEIRYFSAADINFAMAVAEQGGIAIQNAVRYQPNP